MRPGLLSFRLERAKGFEPSTPTLAMVWLGEYANNINYLCSIILACAWFVQSGVVGDVDYSRDEAPPRSMVDGYRCLWI
uniref:Uncharacterized protein n=1 Tax=Magnetospirillum gryphiswaldense TaxID=55518 RepID=A4U0V9_9PROT|nr:hypothetical protein MGR_0339 [Magnetospirillum gryphiswaldense MSR-1]